MTKLNKRLITALSAVSAALLMAIIGLIFPAWANSPGPRIVLIPEILIMQQFNDGRISTWILGAAMFAGCLSGLYLYSKLSLKKSVLIFSGAVVWGSLSWFMGVLPIALGLCAIYGTLYLPKRTDMAHMREYRNNKSQRMFPTTTWNAAGYLLLGTSFGMGLKWGLSEIQMILVTCVFVFFAIPVIIGEFMFESWDESLKKPEATPS